MSRIGVILTGFNMAEYAEPCLRAWVAARLGRLDDHEFVICAVSVPFAGFPNDGEDQTVEKLRSYLDNREIDHLIDSPRNIHETEARGMALTWLKEQHIDLVIQVDLDEFYTEQEISRIFKFVEANPYIVWFRISLKNYVFDENTYLKEPFTPARIHRINANRSEASGFFADNNIIYKSESGNQTDAYFANMAIPVNVAFVKHITWMNNDRSRRKVAYHENHFISRPSGVRSSYSWDEQKGLVFNEAYYAYVKQPVPVVLRD